MKKDNIRFQVQEEISGKWMVHDMHIDAVATLGGCQLMGRSEDRARTACTILTNIYRNRLDASSVVETATKMALAALDLMGHDPSAVSHDEVAG